MSHARSTLAGRARAATALLVLTTLATGTLGAGAEAASAGTAGGSRAELRRDVVASTNHIRAEHGCRPLKVRKGLIRAAQRHANDMSVQGYFSHTSLDGRSWVKRIRAAGWAHPAGENIARGYDTAAEVMRAWVNSPGHRRNILDCRFHYIGVGYTADGQYWVQNFGY